MLNNRKIRLMTKLAQYETKEGKDDIALSRFYRADYVRLQVLKTIVTTTIGYLLTVLMVILYRAEYLISVAVYLDYAAIGKRLLGFYFICLIVFCSAAAIGFTLKYNKSKKKLSKYFRMLKRLRKVYREEGTAEPGASDDNEDGEEVM